MNGARVRFGAREHQWCLSANRWGARRAVRIYFRAVSRLGDGAFWYALMLALVMVDGWNGLDTAARMAVVGGVATLLYRRLKQWTRRPRPFAQDQRIHAWIPPLDEYSFPSGHTLHAVGFSVVACAAIAVGAKVSSPGRAGRTSEDEPPPNRPRTCAAPPAPRLPPGAATKL